MADSTPEEESAGQDVPEKDTADDNVLDEMLSKSLDEAYAEEPEEPQDDGTTSEEIEAQDEDTAQDEAPPPEDVEASEGETDHEEVKAETPEVPPLDAPQHWSAADKERFNGMPRDAQEYVLERDKSMTADYTRKTQDVAQIRQAYEPLHHVLNPMRQALQQAGISEAEYVARLIQADRNLQQNLAAITGKGYTDAFDRAMGQFNVEQDRGRGVQEDINKFGLAALARQANLGAVQRDIDAEGITADRLQFEEERDFPYKQVQYMQSLLQELPLATKSYTYQQPSPISTFASGAGNLASLTDAFTDYYRKTFGEV